jgi:hypothetical protein
MPLTWARSVNPLPLNESITTRPACASADAGVKAATKQIAAATHDWRAVPSAAALRSAYYDLRDFVSHECGRGEAGRR